MDIFTVEDIALKDKTTQEAIIHILRNEGMLVHLKRI